MTEHNIIKEFNLVLPELKTILNDGEKLKILNYKKPFEETIFGNYVGREIDFEEIDSFITPFEQWFVRNHFKVPEIDIDNWNVILDGLFEKPISIGLDEIRSLKKKALVVTVECTGNSALTSKVIKKVSLFRLISKGINYANPLKWKELFDFLNRGGRNGMISTAEFSGIRLLDLLERYPIQKETRELIFQGLDQGYDRILDYITLRKIPYERSMTLKEIIEYDPIISFEMNGKPLPVIHGYPLRMVFPGVMGADHVKWLYRITATDKSFDGHFMKSYYRNEEEAIENGKKVWRSYPARIQPVKSAIIRILKESETIKVFGVAWCGKHPIKEVFVSNDGGNSWLLAEFLFQPGPYRWVFWRCVFQNCRKGQMTFIPRAVDSQGNQQPLERQENLFYGNNVVIPASVIIS